MSNIYILEPPTSGKVLLKTSVGDIDIELWAKETPRTCRNFIQLCMEGYYDGTIFHRIVKGFIAQGGDPNGDGTGGESVYGETFKDEFHQRLRFVRRGLLAMANAGKDDNGSQFFFTLAPATELQNKHTIFGKVTGETLFNMLKLEEGLIEDERPLYPHKILKTEILNNPFTDIEPRQKEVKTVEKKKKLKIPGVKNFKLLSFGEEAEEDEEETAIEAKKYAGKSKSTHDILDDPKLSSEISVVASSSENSEEITEPDPDEQLENIRKKLKGNNKKPVSKKSYEEVDPTEEFESYLFEERNKERKRKRDEIQKEIENVKREYQQNKLQKSKEDAEEKEEQSQKKETIQEYKDEFDKYKEMNKAFPKKGPSREEFTLSLLAKFKQKLSAVKDKEREEEEARNAEVTEVEEENEDESSWLKHELHFKDDDVILAKDANTKGDDWFEIYDPRNPLNKRRRGEATSSSKKPNT